MCMLAVNRKEKRSLVYVYKNKKVEDISMVMVLVKLNLCTQETCRFYLTKYVAILSTEISFHEIRLLRVTKRYLAFSRMNETSFSNVLLFVLWKFRMSHDSLPPTQNHQPS